MPALPLQIQATAGLPTEAGRQRDPCGARQLLQHAAGCPGCPTAGELPRLATVSSQVTPAKRHCCALKARLGCWPHQLSINHHIGPARCLQETARQGCPCSLHSRRRGMITGWSCSRRGRNHGGLLTGLPLKPTPTQSGQNNCGPAAGSLGAAGHEVLRLSHERSTLTAMATRTMQTSGGVPGRPSVGCGMLQQPPCRRTES